MNITKDLILKGIQQNVVRLITDPNLNSGTVCGIGDNWFYFGGETAENASPEEFIKTQDLEKVADMIVEAIKEIGEELDEDEANYYEAVLSERVRDQWYSDSLLKTITQNLEGSENPFETVSKTIESLELDDDIWKIFPDKNGMKRGQFSSYGVSDDDDYEVALYFVPDGKIEGEHKGDYSLQILHGDICLGGSYFA